MKPKGPEQFCFRILHQLEISAEMNQAGGIGIAECDPALDRQPVFGTLHGVHQRISVSYKQE